MGIRVYTIGFTKISAQDFFEKIKSNQISKVIDVRLNNTSQLSGFAKANDLKYFLKSICNTSYVHTPSLTPTKTMLDSYKKDKGPWDLYAEQFLDLMKKREIEKRINPEKLENSCLLCSEDTPHHCHRRLVVDYLNGEWGNSIDVKHL